MKPSELYTQLDFGFGDLSREEINKVMKNAGSCLPIHISFKNVTPIYSNLPNMNGTTPSTSSSTTSLVSSNSSFPISENHSALSNGINDSNKNELHNSFINSHHSPILNSTNTTLNGKIIPTITKQTETSSLSHSPIPAPKPLSWASLVKASLPPTPSSAIYSATPSNKNQNPNKQDFGHNFEVVLKTKLIQPRGLINNGNMCFMNAALQPLAHCPPFHDLMHRFCRRIPPEFRHRTPLLRSIITFFNEFKVMEKSSDVEGFGTPFHPEYVYDALRSLKRFDSMKGRQEDAEEFLGFLLDGLHEEFLVVQELHLEKKLISGKAKHVPSVSKENTVSNGQDGWMEVGPKNKTSALRTTEIVESPISHIFGGKVRSVLKCPSTKDSVSLEPFQSLPLDIQPDFVHNIEDAIHNMIIPETMHDFISPHGSKVEATKQLYLESFPPILILHLKRFLYDNVGGIQKLHKPVGYSTTLHLQNEWLSSTRRTLKTVTYKLFGIVYHHGKSATGGHYTCDVQRQNKEWIHIDDTNITLVTEDDVIFKADKHGKSEKDRLAYLLFYMRT